MNHNLAIHHLWFTVAATTPITLPSASGSAVRGALVNALRQHYCPDSALRPRGTRIEADPDHRAICPVCWLIALEDATGERGRNVQRPYTIEPPPGHLGRIEPGQQFSFGLSLIGRAVNLFPYLILAVPEMGRLGIGQFDRQRGGRGQFLLREVTAINPLSGTRQPLLADGTHLSLPAIPVEAALVENFVSEVAEQATANDNRLEIHFRTPTRIIADSRLVHRPAFGPLYQRLVERVEGLARYYASDQPNDNSRSKADLVALANDVEVVEDQTTWVELTSGSHRLGRATPIGGYQGRVAYRAEDWRPLLPLLLWGQSLHVGKSAVKGDGWFTIGNCPGWPPL